MAVNTIEQIISDFSNRNISLWTEQGKLKYKAAAGTLSKADIEILKANKENIIEFLENENVTIIADEDRKYESFPLTEIQQAYILGRSNAFEYGGVACHIYMELKYDELEPEKVEEVWNKLIERHPMLRAKMSMNGLQQVMEKPEKFKVEDIDVRDKSDDEQKKALDRIKSELDHKVYNPEQWPLYTVKVSRGSFGSIMHFSIEFLVADWLSIWNVLSEFEQMYFEPDKELSIVDVTFRDYQVAEQKLRKGMKFYKDKQYWLERVKTMPMAPELPMKNNNKNVLPRFERRQFLLESENWEKIKLFTRKYGVTPTATVMTVYGLCLAKWSQNKSFCLNLSILNRLPLHKDVTSIVGDFTASSLLEMEYKPKETFVEMVKETNAQLFEDLDHRLFNGVQVLRELQKLHGNKGTIMPYVFTSAIGLLTNEQSSLRGKMTDRGISQTPQVFLDCQVMDTYEGLNINFDSRVGIFPDGFIDDFKETFQNILLELAENEGIWKQPDFEIEIPKWQMKERNLANTVAVKQDRGLLQEKVIRELEKNPERLAVADAEAEWSSRELLDYVKRVKNKLIDLKIKRGDRVAILLPKSRWQFAACLGVLEAGATYVPLDVNHAKKRNELILVKTRAKAVICLDKDLYNLDGVEEICISELSSEYEDKEPIERADLEDVAYIIFTSGSTGEPKGVVIPHRAAVNTIEEINRMYSINENDRVFQLSQLNFDLSVYDLFGVPAKGGAVIIPDKDQYKNPAHWEKMMNKYKVTVWNSVPALMQMFMIYAQYSEDAKKIPLKVALLSGDWIPIELPDSLMDYYENLKVVSLGGATEGGIWSIYHNCIKGEIVEKGYISVPYGKPLANQGYMVLDRYMQECPVYVAGDLYITGDSLASEYWGDEELTKKAFFKHKNIDCYRTGDRGCYLPGGEIEFLGRADNQVKLRGHRIELGEIEAVYKKYFDIQSVSCVMCDKQNEKFIAAVYKKNSENSVLDNRDRILNEWLPDYMIPSYDIAVEEIPLTANGKVDVKKIRELVLEYVSSDNGKETVNEDLNDLQGKLAVIFEDILQIDRIGLKEDFYEAGANSLMLARIAGRLNQEVDGSISFEEYLVQLLNEPNIYSLAAFIENKKSENRSSDRDDSKTENNENDENKENSENKNTSEGIISLFKCDSENSYNIILLKNLKDDMRKAIADEWLDKTNLIFLKEGFDIGEVHKLVEAAEYINVVAMDSCMKEELELSSLLLESGEGLEKVILIEGNEETDAEVENPYMGDISYVITLSEKEDEAEIEEALSEVCFGEITLLDGRTKERLIRNINELMRKE